MNNLKIVLFQILITPSLKLLNVCFAWNSGSMLITRHMSFEMQYIYDFIVQLCSNTLHISTFYKPIDSEIMSSDIKLKLIENKSEHQRWTTKTIPAFNGESFSRDPVQIKSETIVKSLLEIAYSFYASYSIICSQTKGTLLDSCH